MRWAGPPSRILRLLIKSERERERPNYYKLKIKTPQKIIKEWVFHYKVTVPVPGTVERYCGLKSRERDQGELFEHFIISSPSRDSQHRARVLLSKQEYRGKAHSQSHCYTKIYNLCSNNNKPVVLLCHVSYYVSSGSATYVQTVRLIITITAMALPGLAP